MLGAILTTRRPQRTTTPFTEPTQQIDNQSQWIIVIAISVVLICVFVSCLVRSVCSDSRKRNSVNDRQRYIAQQHGQHIFNISGRVPEQHHCTPDAYLTVEHINVTNQMNKPSCYNDEPPSYEDAIKMVQGGTAHAPATQQPHSAAAIPAVHRLSV
ncbi:uncharacterized protein LOC132707961 isoform X1 [Cylas formicarius]|uniref:uncharacterized protein LOC132707961 isoform X1 n=1 Tax=Cylas formicarius TaxID=197179 RepID=UPI002958C9B0|nr:uncharacterized protein LOC132707961 isoform X1 [Cylas formicarius]